MCLQPYNLHTINPYTGECLIVQVGCGKCFECATQRARAWSMRMYLESKLHEENCFLTLTYKDNPLSLNIEDYQKFLKRFRKSVDKPIRYFLCGEYGSLKGRPHYHLAVFGWAPKKANFLYKDSKGFPVYRSEEVEKSWTAGISAVGELTPQSCLYISGYMQKLHPNAQSHTLKRPFVRMSTRPGIGYGAMDPRWLDSDKIYDKGKFVKVPRYFLDKLSSDFGFVEEVEQLKERRLNTALKVADISPTDLDKLEKEHSYYKQVIDDGYYELDDLDEWNEKLIQSERKIKLANVQSAQSLRKFNEFVEKRGF